MTTTSSISSTTSNTVTTTTTACHDVDFGASDMHSRSCAQYTAHMCQFNMDDSDFNASQMCCVCGGGRKECVDTDFGSIDARGRSCKEYAYDMCGGTFDDADFNADAMCCACKGGSGGSISISPLSFEQVEATSAPTNTTTTTSTAASTPPEPLPLTEDSTSWDTLVAGVGGSGTSAYWFALLALPLLVAICVLCYYCFYSCGRARPQPALGNGAVSPQQALGDVAFAQQEMIAEDTSKPDGCFVLHDSAMRSDQVGSLPEVGSAIAGRLEGSFARYGESAGHLGPRPYARSIAVRDADDASDAASVYATTCELFNQANVLSTVVGCGPTAGT